MPGPAVVAVDVRKLYRRFLHKNQFKTLKSAIVSGSLLKDLTPEHRDEIIKLRKVYDDVVLSIIRRGRESGHFANLDEQIVSYLIPSMIIRSNIWFSPKGRLTAEQVGDTMFELIYQGIKTRTGNPAGSADCQAERT